MARGLKSSDRRASTFGPLPSAPCSKGDVIRDVYKFHVLITTFEMVIADAAVLRAIPWTACVVDEAHRCVELCS